MMKARIDTLLEEVFFCIIEPSIEKREKSIRKKLEVYRSVYNTLLYFHWCVYTLRLVGGVHTTLPYTTPPGKKIVSYTLLD